MITADSNLRQLALRENRFYNQHDTPFNPMETRSECLA